MKLSIKKVLIGGIFVGILILVSLIVFSSYYSSKKVMLRHADNIMNTISSLTLDKSLQFMQKAKNAADLSKRLATNKVVNSENSDLMFKYFYEQLEMNDHFSSIYYGSKNGDFIMLLKNKKGFLRKEILNTGDKRKVLKIQYDKKMKTVLSKDENPDKYDPRVRPWYIKALTQKDLIWTSPYVFFTSKQPGITTAAPIFNKDKKIEGVVGVDIEINDLAKFISNLKISENSKVFMMDSSLKMIAFPDKNTVKYNKEKETSELKSIFEIDDEISLSAYNRFKQKNLDIKNKELFSFEVDDGTVYHSLFLPFKINNIEWIIGMYLPENDYLGDIIKNQKMNVIISFIFALVFIVISYFIARSIIKPIEELEDMAHELKVLNLNVDNIQKCTYSEINETIEAVNKMKEGLKEAYSDTIFRLAMASEYKDLDTAEHIKRVGLYCRAIGKRLNLSDDELFILENASTMHDVGKLAIGDDILLKPGKLTKDERVNMQRHAELGANILSNPTSEIMEYAREICLYHHEKWDGNGYPHKLKGEDIPLFARIVAIADVFDALASRRCYKEAYGVEKAKDMIVEAKGTHFDPKCVDAFDDAFEEIIEIYEKYRD
jgi:putative two-component system response regulator